MMSGHDHLRETIYQFFALGLRGLRSVSCMSSGRWRITDRFCAYYSTFDWRDHSTSWSLFPAQLAGSLVLALPQWAAVTLRLRFKTHPPISPIACVTIRLQTEIKPSHLDHVLWAFHPKMVAQTPSDFFKNLAENLFQSCQTALGHESSLSRWLHPHSLELT
jgi:hypothetical protein